MSAFKVNVLQNPGAFYGSTGFEHCWACGVLHCAVWRRYRL